MDLDYYWIVGNNYTGKSGWIHSVETGMVDILGLLWKYVDGTNWLDDCTLKVHDKKEVNDARNIDDSKYPDIVTLSSKGAAAMKQWDRMGIYKKMCRVTRNDKPVWKMRGGEQYLYYFGE